MGGHTWRASSLFKNEMWGGRGRGWEGGEACKPRERFIKVNKRKTSSHRLNQPTDPNTKPAHAGRSSPTSGHPFPCGGPPTFSSLPDTVSDSSNKNKSLRKKNALTCAYFAFLIIMTIVVIFLVTEGVHVFPPGKFFFSYKASFKRCRNRRREAGPSQPASLQTRAHLVCLRV